MAMAMAADPSDLVSPTTPLPDDVQFFASVLTMPTEPVDSTLAFGAHRQGLFLTPTEALFHVFETPPADGRKVPGKVVTWTIPRRDVVTVTPDDREPCLVFATATTTHRACLGAIAHHRDEVVAAVDAWVSAHSEPEAR